MKNKIKFLFKKHLQFQFTDNGENLDLAMSSRDNWKRMRSIMNPTFSSVKLKQVRA